MKHEIEIPDLPEDLEPVAYKVPEVGEYYFGSGGITLARVKFENLWLVVRKKRPRRIVLEETGRHRGLQYLLKIDEGNLILPPGREYKIVEDNKCAE